MENSLALFPTTSLWPMHCVFLGKLDRRACRVFSSFCGYFALGDGLRSRASPAHLPAAKQESVGESKEDLQRFQHSDSSGDHPKPPTARS